MVKMKGWSRAGVEGCWLEGWIYTVVALGRGRVWSECDDGAVGTAAGAAQAADTKDRLEGRMSQAGRQPTDAVPDRRHSAATATAWAWAWAWLAGP